MNSQRIPEPQPSTENRFGVRSVTKTCVRSVTRMYCAVKMQLMLIVLAAYSFREHRIQPK